MSEGIAYQNKDILFKILGQTYKEKNFAAYGIDLPPIKELLPTSLPKISANEKDIHRQVWSSFAGHTTQKRQVTLSRIRFPAF